MKAAEGLASSVTNPSHAYYIAIWHIRKQTATSVGTRGGQGRKKAKQHKLGVDGTSQNLGRSALLT
jgi:hypothetical protein